MDTTRSQIKALRAGHPAAFDAIYAEYRPRLHGFLLRMTGRRAVAEELLQETWLRLAHRATSLDEDTDLAAWLFTVARNLARSFQRWQLLDLDRLSGLLAAPQRHSESPFETVMQSEAHRSLERGLAALNLKDREVLLLVGVEGLTPTQAANVVGLKPEALRQRLARARARLEAHLTEAGTLEVPGGAR